MISQEQAARSRVRRLGVAALIALAVCLIAYVYVGSYTRYMADDYCRVSILHAKGFWGAQRHWYEQWTGKFSHILTVSLAESIGSWVVGEGGRVIAFAPNPGAFAIRRGMCP